MEDYKYYSHTDTKRRVLFIIGLVFTSLGMIIALILAYLSHILLGYYRIGDKKLDIDRGENTKEVVKVGDVLSAATYNIGFGAYSQDFTFFLDTGYDANGKETCGSRGTAKSLKEVNFNTNGIIDTLKTLNPDFIMMQEVDIHSARSYYVNQDKRAQENFAGYDHIFANNFHTAFLPYPFYDMHGDAQSGLSTFSRYKVTPDSANRKSYTVSDSMSKIFDLDRCYSYMTVEVSNGKKLYVVNSHMSAYDEGGVIRAKQVEEIRALLELVAQNDDYLILGGDFNHDLLRHNPLYKNGDGSFKYTNENKPYGETKKDPTWVSQLFREDGTSPLTDPIKVGNVNKQYQIFASDSAPTCRNNDIIWVEGRTYVVTVDGFVCSENIEMLSVETIATNNGNLGTRYFAYSDHQPVKLSFKLK